jgi:DNA-directed RNA polymerase beta subunit
MLTCTPPSYTLPTHMAQTHGFPSRMTMAQLREMLSSMVACMLGKDRVDATPFSRNTDGMDIFDLCKEAKVALTKAGYNQHGHARMLSGTTGEPLDTPVFSGESSLRFDPICFDPNRTDPSLAR